MIVIVILLIENFLKLYQQTGTGTSGSYYDANSYDFPAVPYSGLDFNDGNCYTSSGSIENYGDADQVDIFLIRFRFQYNSLQNNKLLEK